MDGLLLLLVLIGASFFVMTRFVDGSHMTRRHEGGCCSHKATREVSRVDPVCDNEVSDDQGYSRSYDGHVYRFCSRECLENFEATPEKFIKDSESGDASLAA